MKNQQWTIYRVILASIA